MRKLLHFFFFFYVYVCSCDAYAQQRIADNKIINKDGVRYVVYNDVEYLLDTEILTIKLGSEELPEYIKKQIIRTNKLGFADVRIPVGEDIVEYAEKLRRSELFEEVEFNSYGIYSSISANDTYRNNQSFLDIINIPQTWCFTTGGSNIKVAMLDSGVDTTHEDLGVGSDGYTNLMLTCGDNPGLNSVGEHGTCVAGVISAKTNNGVGISGIAGGYSDNGCRLIPYFVGSSAPDTNIIDDKIIDAVDDGAKIIQISFEVASTYSINMALYYAYSNNVIVICAAGNNSSSQVRFPASSQYTLAVGATNQNNQRAYFSDYGSDLDVVAPGVNILTTKKLGGYQLSSGTSFSAPIVSGIAALMLSVNSSLTASQIYNTLRSTARRLPGYTYNVDGWNDEVGYGMVDAYSAVKAVINWGVIGDELVCDTTTYYASKVPIGGYVTWTINNNYYWDNNLFLPNYPDVNSFTIVRDNMLRLDDNLTATIYDADSNPVKTISKHVHSRDIAEFSYQYESDGPMMFEMITEREPTRVPANTTITIVNRRFRNMTVSSSGTDVYHDGDTVKIRTPRMSATIYAQSQVDCDNFSFTIYTSLMPVVTDPILPRFESSGDGTLTVSLINSTGNDDNNQTVSCQKDNKWQISIYSYENGKIMCSQEVIDDRIIIPTHTWKKGIYLCRIVVGGNAHTKKIKL